MAKLLIILALCAVGLLGAFGLMSCGGPAPVAARAPSPAAGAPAVKSWSFDDAAAESAALDFQIESHGPGRPAVWKILNVTDAPSGKNILAQTDDDDTNHRYNVALSPGQALADVRVQAEGKAVSGSRDRSFGVVARWQDGNTYYLARCNTSGWGSNVRLYCFLNGERKEIADAAVDAKHGAWYHIALEVQGDQIVAIFGDKEVLRVTDTSISGPGRCGVWTKAESVSYFDNLQIIPLGVTP